MDAEQMTMKRILVAGGAGFLGSHLCDALIAQPNQMVFCLDNFSTGRLANIQHLLKHPRFELLRYDVTLPFELQIDEIYHLASPASPYHYQLDPVQTLKTNVLGCIHLLELARRAQAKLLFASTSEIYGDPLVHPQTEDYWGNVNPIGPRACYDEAKRCGETLCFEYNRQQAIPVKVVRIFNTYGPRMWVNDGRIVSNFIYQAIHEKPVTIFGDGSQTRSLCYVTDLVEGLINMMKTSDEFTGPVNLGNPEERSVKEIAELVIELTHSRSPLVYQALPEDDPKRRRPDITLAKKALNWQPKVDIQSGLAQTIVYFLEQKQS